MGEEGRAAKRGRPVRVEGERGTRERILEAAIDLFAERGYEGGSVRQIAAAVGLTEAAVYRHFPSKEAILDEILACAERGVFTPLPIETDLGAGGGDSVFRGLLACLPRIVAAHPEIVKIMRIMLAEMQRNARVEEFYRRLFVERADDHLEALFRRCIEAGTIRACDPRALARVFNAFRAEWAFDAFILDYPAPPDVQALERDLEAPIAFFEGLFAPREG